MLAITASILVAYGRAASAAACARRSFEAATICIALVIFCVALVEAMRTRMSLSEAMDYPRAPLGSLPPWGGGLGRGVLVCTETRRIPPSLALPLKGGGNTP